MIMIRMVVTIMIHPQALKKYTKQVGKNLGEWKWGQIWWKPILEEPPRLKS